MSILAVAAAAALAGALSGPLVVAPAQADTFAPSNYDLEVIAMWDADAFEAPSWDAKVVGGVFYAETYTALCRTSDMDWVKIVRNDTNGYVESDGLLYRWLPLEFMPVC